MQIPQPPFTPASLLEFAEKCEAEYKQLSEAHPAGTIHDGRNDARRNMEHALHCAKWMEKQGIKELTYVGSFGPQPMNESRAQHRALRDSKARIRAGATIRSLHPSKGGVIVIDRARTVTVHDVYNGYVELEPQNRRRFNSDDEAFLASVKQPEVVWAGTSGYWCHADINDVEFLGHPEPKAEPAKIKKAKP